MSNNSDFTSLLDSYSKQRRSRIIAVQAAYSIYLNQNDESLELTLSNILDLYLLGHSDPDKYLNKILISKVFDYVVKNVEAIDYEIKKYLKNEDSFDSMSLNLKAILRCAIAEFICFQNIDSPITINEYTDITKEFESAEKSKFINAILDKASKSLRK